MEASKQEMQLMERSTADARESIFLSLDRFEFAKRVASMLAASNMVPTHFQGQQGVGNCMIMLNLAERLGVDVFGLMQTSYIVHGRPGFEAKLLIAMFNERSKLFIPPLRWEMKGDFPAGKDAGCRAYAIDKQTKETIYGEWIDWNLVSAEGWDKDKPLRSGGGVQKSKWNTMPGQMFRYRSASFFINAYEPGLKMGIQTLDELEDSVIDVTPARTLKADAPKEIEEGRDPYAASQFPGQEKPLEENKAPEAIEDGGTVETDPENVNMDDELHTMDQFWRLQTSGLKKYEEENRGRIRTWTGELKSAWQNKWRNVIGKEYDFSGPESNPNEDPPSPTTDELFETEIAAFLKKRHGVSEEELKAFMYDVVQRRGYTLEMVKEKALENPDEFGDRVLDYFKKKEAEKSNGGNGAEKPSIHCSTEGRRMFVDVCKAKCGFAKDCKDLQEWEAKQ